MMYDVRMKTEKINGQRIRCYDSGPDLGSDRYTVVYMDQPENERKMFACVGMNESPFSPCGIGQHSTAMIGKHLGKRIPFEALPEDCQKLVNMDTEP
jgi:hypothetical protein